MTPDRMNTSRIQGDIDDLVELAGKAESLQDAESVLYEIECLRDFVTDPEGLGTPWEIAWPEIPETPMDFSDLPSRRWIGRSDYLPGHGGYDPADDVGEDALEEEWNEWRKDFAANVRQAWGVSG